MREEKVNEQKENKEKEKETSDRKKEGLKDEQKKGQMIQQIGQQKKQKKIKSDVMWWITWLQQGIEWNKERIRNRLKENLQIEVNVWSTEKERKKVTICRSKKKKEGIMENKNPDKSRLVPSLEWNTINH